MEDRATFNRHSPSSGLNRRLWSLRIDTGRAIAEFPGERGYYDVAVKMINVSGMDGTIRLLHLRTKPAPSVQTNISTGGGGGGRTVYGLRSFVVQQGRVVEDCCMDRMTMEYHSLDLNSTRSLELICIGDDGDILSDAQGVCLLEVRDIFH